jgi:hypothetical protein
MSEKQSKLRYLAKLLRTSRGRGQSKDRSLASTSKAASVTEIEATKKEKVNRIKMDNLVRLDVWYPAKLTFESKEIEKSPNRTMWDRGRGNDERTG